MASTDPVALTQALVRYKTVNPPGDEHDCAHHLGEMLEAAGFEVTYVDAGERRTNVVARLGNGQGAPLCFTGHIDTVPLGAQPWTVDPFDADIVDGKLYGRGATDMKAGVAAFVAAAIDLSDKLADGPGVVLVITSGEETGCDGAFHLTEQDDVLGEAGAMIVAEPTSNYPLVGHKGALWLHALAHGVTAHGSTPEHGENAVYKAARMVGELARFDFERPPHEVLGRDTLNVGTIAGGLNMNSVPDVCRIGIDIRTTPGASHDEIRGALDARLGEDLAKLETVVDLEGVWTEPQQAWVAQVYRMMAEILDETPAPRGAAFFTDASALTPFYGDIPTVILGPGEAALAHQTDEYCYVDRITQAKTVYETLIEHWQAA
ncbi:succinyl-diaminopimelate desuccinylase [Salinisphaera shabanensis T35B1]|uniref:M20 family metallopeptidase n=1 Tax=Salinisphaera shabanensis TaxID=180542 RepID=UPI003340810F